MSADFAGLKLRSRVYVKILREAAQEKLNSGASEPRAPFLACPQGPTSIGFCSHTVNSPVTCSTMRNLYVVVHPEATHHVQGLVGGQYDSQLTIRGVRAAERIADALYNQIPQGTPVEVYSSDLTRCRESADVIAERMRVDVTFDERLREKSYGIAEGKPQKWLDERFIAPPAPPASNEDRLNHFEGIADSETKLEWVSRIYSAMDDILSTDCRNQIIVTHGGSITFVVAKWIGMPIESVGYVSFKAPPGSISVLKEDGFWRNRQVAVLGDISHLEIPR
jgi:probable phosphoglycerate mutase